MNNTLEVFHLNRGSEIEHSYEAKYIWRVETVEKTRDSFVDQLKGLACFLVVFGHVIMGIRKAGISTPKSMVFVKEYIWTFSLAIFVCVVLFVVATVCCIASKSLMASFLLLLYLCLNVAYSMGLKNVPILDVSILVSGFLIRLICGAVAADIVVSNWLYLTVISLAFYLALGKRRNELKKTAGNTRSVLKKYPESFLDKNMYLFLALAIVFYALWSVDPVTIGFYGLAAKGLVWTVPLLCLITLRYSFDVEGDSDGDPVEVVVHDFYIALLQIHNHFLKSWTIKICSSIAIIHIFYNLAK